MLFKNGYALVIGVDENLDQELNLETVAKDVKAVYETLIHPERCAYDPDNVKLLSGPESTRGNIIEALDWLAKKVNADDNATAVLYYSGHGWVDTSKDLYYLIPYDIKDRNKLNLYALPAQDFTDLIAEVDAQRMLAVLDCCHANGMGVKSVEALTKGQFKAIPVGDSLKPTSFPTDLPQTKAIPEFKGTAEAKAVSDLAEGEGRAILNSSTGSEYSWTRADGKMSLFTYHLIEALTGHHPHNDDDKVVYVTDVMSWVTREVKKSAAAMGVTQTPVMRTSGVFPIAQLIGGKGLSKSAGETPPAPLAHLSPAATTTTINQEGQAVKTQVNIGKNEGEIGHIGDNINTDGGAYIRGGVQMDGGDFVGRDKVIQGDEVRGDKITGDKFDGDKFTGDKVMGNKTEGDNINVGNISGSQGIAIGRKAKADVKQTIIHQPPGGGGENYDRLFAPLLKRVQQNSPDNLHLVNDLQEQVTADLSGNDKSIAKLIQQLAFNAPALQPALVGLFQHPAIAPNIGPFTEYALETLE